MANYVFNKVICNKETLKSLFIHYNPFGPEETKEEPYIGFRKIYETIESEKLKSRDRTDIYYGFSFSYCRHSNDTWEIKFLTRWRYPIVAIIQAITLDHDLIWYCVEENISYVSMFYWNKGVKEKVTFLQNEFYKWSEDIMLLLDVCDDPVWYYPEFRHLK